MIRVEDCDNVTEVDRFEHGGDHYAIVVAVDPGDGTTHHIFAMQNERPFEIGGFRIHSTVNLETRQDMQVVVGLRATQLIKDMTRQLILDSADG